VLNPLPFEGLPWGDGTSSRTTFVILASDAPLPLDRLGSDPLRVALTVSAAQFDQMLARGRAVVLTDDFAPVDGLTARLFRSRLP
jgi:hypothetical protein